MRARLVIVPLDLRMSADAVEGIVKASEARHLILGSGRDAPDPREAGLDHFPTTIVESLSAEPDDSFPADWEQQLARWPRPAADDLFELVFTSGTTGTPKGVMLAHDNVLASIESFHRIVPPMDHRIVSLLPLSHLLEQAVGLREEGAADRCTTSGGSTGVITPASERATSSRAALSRGISARLMRSSMRSLPAMPRMNASSVASEVISCIRSIGLGLRPTKRDANRSSTATCRAES